MFDYVNDRHVCFCGDIEHLCRQNNYPHLIVDTKEQNIITYPLLSFINPILL